MRPNFKIKERRELSRRDLDREMGRTLRTVEIAAKYSMQMYRNKARTTLKTFLSNLKTENENFSFRAQFSFKRNIFEVIVIDGETEYKCAPNGYCAVKSKSDDWKLDSDFVDTLESVCQMVRDLIQDVEEANLKYKKVMELF